MINDALLQATAQKMYALWKPALIQHSAEHQEDRAGVFPGLINFLGTQNVMWPEWLRLCAGLGMEIHPRDKAYDLQSNDFHGYAWYTLFLAYATDTALVLTGGASWPQSTVMCQALRASDVRYCLSTMENDGRILLSGTARDKLSSSGIVVSGKDIMQIPGTTCEELQTLWPAWEKSTALVFPVLSAFVEQNYGDADFSVRYTFALIAHALWQHMVADQLLDTHLAKQRTFLQKIGLARTPRLYQGVMLIQGNYENLWKTIQRKAV